MSLLDLANPYHAYVYGTSFWYFLRGIMRIIDPATVAGWFRPPVHKVIEANDLELYTLRTDAWGLIALSAVLLVVADAMPLPGDLIGSSLADNSSSRTKKLYARAVVLITMFHHIMTGIGSFQHWKLATHRTVAMDIGVFGNLGLVSLGLLALLFGLGERSHTNPHPKKKA